MAIVSSGVISIQSLVGEYGGSAPHGMNEYYRGGGLVPNTSNTASIPTSGTIQLDDFYGTSASNPNDMFISGNLGSYYITQGKSATGFAGVGETNQAITNGQPQLGSWIDNSLLINGNSRTAQRMNYILAIIANDVPTIFFNASMAGLVSNWSSSAPYSATGSCAVSTSQVSLTGYSRFQGIPTTSGLPASHTLYADNGSDFSITFS